ALGELDSLCRDLVAHDPVITTGRWGEPRQGDAKFGCAPLQPFAMKWPQRRRALIDPDRLYEPTHLASAGVALRAATAVWTIIAPTITTPPMTASTVGTSPITNQVHTGLSAVSMISSSEASSAR